jgi:predicted glycosyltransferase
VAGPFLPDEDWRWLEAAARQSAGLQVVRAVPDLGAMFARAGASVSQCGYNTAMDILASRVPALVVPFAAGREDEQTNRARRLERLGLLRMLDPIELNGATLAQALRELVDFRPSSTALDLNGARNTARLVAKLVARSARLIAPQSGKLRQKGKSVERLA